MAYQKRTWLARLGSGLNKFIIGDKDSNNKQTLTNSPDSVTQQGDVISADNLNDLEDRIDNEFTSQSTRINGKQDTLTFDNVPTSGSSNPVKSGGVYSALAGKQNTLTFDDAPTNGSNNPVKSGGIFTALAGKADKLTKIWENSSPTAVFMGQTINNLAVDAGTEAIAIEYYATHDNPSLCRAIKVLHFGSEASTNFVLEQLRPVSNALYVHLRGVSISKSGSSLAVTFDNSDMWYLTAEGNAQYEGGGRNCTPLAIYKVNAF